MLNDPSLNRGTAFSSEEREELGIEGLLPPGHLTLEQQVERVLENCARKPTNLERYIFLMSLLDRNETLFYRTLLDHLPDYLPIIYTPTVGEAAKLYGHIFRRPRGLYVTAEHRGRVADVLENWEEDDVRVVVVTDGSRILGLGDLGANGMSIPVGKLALYTAVGGIDPRKTLPVMLDVGTDNQDLLDDPLYLGLHRRRLSGEAYLALVDEFMEAVASRYPAAVIQFEDFVTEHAYELLTRYRDTYRMFNDDIQGTAAVGLAGLLAAGRIAGGGIADRRYLFVGAGSANTGIANLLVSALREEGLSEAAAHERCWFFDAEGLLTSGRPSIPDHARDFAHDARPESDLATAVRRIEPGALVGATGVGGLFGREVLEAMGDVAARPIVFALSNPTDNAEVTAQNAYRWTDGRAIFASGSPFDAVEHAGSRFEPGQANNVYVFPGVGLGIMTCECERISDEMFLAAARAVADAVTDERIERGSVFPALERIRDVSVAIAAAVAESVGAAVEPADIRATMYEPTYD